MIILQKLLCFDDHVAKIHMLWNRNVFVLMMMLQNSLPPFETPRGIHTRLAKFVKVCELMRDISLRFSVHLTRPQSLDGKIFSVSIMAISKLG